MKREKASHKKLEPTPSDRVCSVQFEEGIPNPSIKLDYELQVTPKRRKLEKRTSMSVQMQNLTHSSATDHDYSFNENLREKCASCQDKKSWTDIKSDQKMKFCTGIQSIAFFNLIFEKP